MINYVLQAVLELRGFILLMVAIFIFLSMSTLVFMGKRKPGIGSFGIWEALLISSNQRGLCQLSLGFLEIGFVAALLLKPAPMGRGQLILLILLCLSQGCIGWSVESLLAELLYGMMAAAALTAGGLLHDFMAETGFDWYILVIRILLSGFMIQYSLYHFVKGVERILRHNGKASKRLV